MGRCTTRSTGRDTPVVLIAGSPVTTCRIVMISSRNTCRPIRCPELSFILREGLCVRVCIHASVRNVVCVCVISFIRCMYACVCVCVCVSPCMSPDHITCLQVAGVQLSSDDDDAVAQTTPVRQTRSSHATTTTITSRSITRKSLRTSTTSRIIPEIPVITSTPT